MNILIDIHSVLECHQIFLSAAEYLSNINPKTDSFCIHLDKNPSDDANINPASVLYSNSSLSLLYTALLQEPTRILSRASPKHTISLDFSQSRHSMYKYRSRSNANNYGELFPFAATAYINVDAYSFCHSNSKPSDGAFLTSIEPVYERAVAKAQETTITNQCYHPLVRTR